MLIDSWDDLSTDALFVAEAIYFVHITIRVFHVDAGFLIRKFDTLGPIVINIPLNLPMRINRIKWVV